VDFWREQIEEKEDKRKEGKGGTRKKKKERTAEWLQHNEDSYLYAQVPGA